jgi:hypothetical protein
MGKFITVFVLYVEPDVSNPYVPYSISLSTLLPLSSYLCLGSPSGLFPLGSLTKTYMASSSITVLPISHS